MNPTRDDTRAPAPATERRRPARLLDLGIVLSAAAIVALAVAAVRPPRLVAAIPAEAMVPQGASLHLQPRFRHAPPRRP